MGIFDKKTTNRVESNRVYHESDEEMIKGFGNLGTHVAKKVVEEQFLKVKETKEVKQEENEMEEHVDTLIGIVLDATISFTKVFAPFYQIFSRWIDEVESKKGRNVCLRYVLTFLHSDANVYTLKNRCFLTKDELKQAMEQMEFRGGSFDGREDLCSAIEMTLKAMEGHDKSNKHMTRGLMVFSDALPKDQDLQKDFRKGGNDNQMLRFAYVCSYDGSFEPDFLMGRGTCGDNENTYRQIESIEDLIQASLRGESDIIDVDEMMNNLSRNV